MAREVLRDLAPFLAEEGIDLSGPVDLDLGAFNAAFERATSRYNQGLPPLVQAQQRSSGSASGRSSRGTKRGSGQPKLSLADRSAVRGFERWLREEPEIAAPSPEAESGMLTELFKVALHHGFHLRTPQGVVDLVELFVGDDREQEPDGAVNAALGTLHDYVHFRIETGGEPSAWEEIHFLFDDPPPGADVLRAAILETEQLDPDERRVALAGTHLVASVTELLGWIGSGRKVAPSGGVRRADIAHAAKLLGIAAVGVDKLPPYALDTPALIEIEGDAVPADAIRARSMMDVPMLFSWWGALAAAGVIEVAGTRVVPGPCAAEWTAELLPPLDLAEEVVAATVCEYLCEDLGVRSRFFDRDVVAIMIAGLIGALEPGQLEPAPDDDEFGRLLHARADGRLQRLARVGVLNPDAEGTFVVPGPLRGAVASGVLSTFAFLRDAVESD